MVSWSVNMASCGVHRIDDMNHGLAPAQVIGPGDSDRDSVGVIQDFLTGHGMRGLPNVLSPAYGTFGPMTAQAVHSFCADQGLPAQDTVDALALQKMVKAPASDPRASRGYLALVLDFPYNGMNKVLSLVAQMEGAGRFAALNLNTDRAGLSFGLIQWAQKPGRLSEILTAFRDATEQDFVRIFGDGDPQVSNGLIAHTQEPFGGIDVATGQTTDPAFNLIAEPWLTRFKSAALFNHFQSAQVRVALSAFDAFYSKLQSFAPGITSERGVAFMIDLANQHGAGGAEAIYKAAHQPGATEHQSLAAMVDESVRRIQDPFKEATRERREKFLTTTFLSDNAFTLGSRVPVG
jgi:peptidoglycan hydrolase-like protein with peptidoglycan-binding domain